MLILIMGITQTKAFVLDLTTPAASKRQKRRIATYPLLTTRGFHQRRRGIATEPAMLAGNRLGFHAIVSHGVTSSGGVGTSSHPSCSLERCITQPIALSSSIIFILTPDAPCGLQATGVDESTRDEPTLQSQTQSTSMETQSHAARRPQSLPAQTDRSPHTRAQPSHPSPQSGPGASASTREPASGTRRPAQGGRGLLGPATLFSGAHRLSRRLSRPESTRLGSWYQESTVPANHHQLGDTTLDRPH